MTSGPGEEPEPEPEELRSARHAEDAASTGGEVNAAMPLILPPLPSSSHICRELWRDHQRERFPRRSMRDCGDSDGRSDEG